MNDGKICVSICGKTADDVLSRMDPASKVADIIEIRFDCLDPDQIEPLIKRLANYDRQLLITFRPEEQGGRRRLTREERIAFWKLAAARLNRNQTQFDLEYDSDFAVAIDEGLIIGSAHFFDKPPHDYAELFYDLLAFHAGTVKLAVSVNDASDAVDVWKWGNEFGRTSIPIAMGEAGKWTRILGLSRFAPHTYAALDAQDATAPGQITAADLRDVFRVKELDMRTDVYAVLAGDTSYSLSPYMHNASFKIRGLNSVFVPMQVADLDAFMRRMVKGATREVELNFRGFSVTNPHKRGVIKYLDWIDPAAEKIGAVNTIKVVHGKLHGYNTDAPGFIGPLVREFGDLRGARVTIIGAGGASRACVFALKENGADVTLLARDPRRAMSLSEEFDIRVAELGTGNWRLETEILINATPLGTRGKNENETVATAEELRDVKLVYDLVYNPSETRLLCEARSAGAKTIGGLDMLIAQGVKQFEIWTGQQPPVDAMREAIESRLK